MWLFSIGQMWRRGKMVWAAKYIIMFTQNKFDKWLHWAKIYITALDNLSSAEQRIMISSFVPLAKTTQEERELKRARRMVSKRFAIREKARKIILSRPNDIPPRWEHNVNRFIQLLEVASVLSNIMLLYSEQSGFCSRVMEDLANAQKDILSLYYMDV